MGNRKKAWGQKVRRKKLHKEGGKSEAEPESSFLSLTPLGTSPEWRAGGGKQWGGRKMKAFLLAKAIRQLARATGMQGGWGKEESTMISSSTDNP